jgi:YesN/AraC family two-component response regulator
MPQMNGFEFAANVKAIRPDAKIVLMSAFVTDFEFLKSLVAQSDFIRKPVEIKTLVQKVRVAMAN